MPEYFELLDYANIWPEGEHLGIAVEAHPDRVCLREAGVSYRIVLTPATARLMADMLQRMATTAEAGYRLREEYLIYATFIDRCTPSSSA